MGLTGGSQTEVLVVGAGPVGLTMACELTRHGIRSRIIERMLQPSPYCRAIGVSSRTLEVWDDMGIARDAIDAGIWLGTLRSVTRGVVTDLKSEFDLPYAMLGLPQNQTERILTRHLLQYGIEIERGVSLESLEQSDGQVRTVLATESGQRLAERFQYVIGCDGAHSAVRKSAGIGFEGMAIPFEFLLGDVHIAWSAPRGMVYRLIQMTDAGMPEIFVAVPLPEPGRYRVTVVAPPELATPQGGTMHGIQSERPAPGIDLLQIAADQLLPEKVTLSDMRWSSIFRISMRLASHYRRGNVFIAGDAAHIHPPLGGQGMNTGIQDAYNLAWKLSLVMKGVGQPTLLDTYELERHAIGHEVVARTSRPPTGAKPQPEDRLADTQILVSYRGMTSVENTADENVQGPVAGDRAPDCTGLQRVGVGFPLRLFDILRGVEHVLIARVTGENAQADLADVMAFAAELNRRAPVRVVAIVDPGVVDPQLFGVSLYTDHDGQFSKLYGSDATTILIRPDGYLAWRGSSWRNADLQRQLQKTFLG